MQVLHYRWWVPNVSRRPGRPLRRFLTDVEFVAPWPYLVLPALAGICLAIAPELRSGPPVVALLMVTLAWVVALRARFAMAVTINASRDRRRLRHLHPRRPRLAA